VAAFAAPAALVIAHNASFDRRLLERFSPVFQTKPWACSMSEIDWKDEGHEGVKLAYLAAGAGFFYDRHRATSDCAAAIELLARDLPRSGQPALARLLEAATSTRSCARSTPMIGFPTGANRYRLGFVISLLVVMVVSPGRAAPWAGTTMKSRPPGCRRGRSRP
jgi:hypothetical protein